MIADRFASERVFLAGDAAHQLPPNRGGFGANTGIDDVHNLAWKLAAVLNGQSSPRLLATYDAERRPVAELRHDQLFARADYKAYLVTPPTSEVPVLDDTAIELGQLYRSAAVMGADSTLPPARRPEHWAGQPGTRAAHLWIAVEDTRGSTLDLFGRGWTLLSEDDRWRDLATGVAKTSGISVTFVHIGTDAKPVDPDTFRTAYGLQRGGATLVRPDGYIAWRTATAPPNSLAALTAALDTTAMPVQRAAVGERCVRGVVVQHSPRGSTARSGA